MCGHGANLFKLAPETRGRRSADVVPCTLYAVLCTEMCTREKSAWGPDLRSKIRGWARIDDLTPYMYHCTSSAPVSASGHGGLTPSRVTPSQGRKEEDQIVGHTHGVAALTSLWVSKGVVQAEPH